MSDRDKNAVYSSRNRENTSGDTPGSCLDLALRLVVRRLELYSPSLIS